MSEPIWAQEGHAFTEYRIIPVQRYIVTRYDAFSNQAGNSPRQVGAEYTNHEMAYQVAYALARQQHEDMGEPIDSMRVIYPKFEDGAQPSEPTTIPV